MAITSVISASRCILAGHITTATTMGLAVVVSTVAHDRVQPLDWKKIRTLPPFEWSAAIIPLASALTLGGLGARLHPICGIAMGSVYGAAAVAATGLFGYGLWNDQDDDAVMFGRLGLVGSLGLSILGVCVSGTNLTYRLGRWMFRLPETMNFHMWGGPLDILIDAGFRALTGSKGSLTLGFTGVFLGTVGTGLAGVAWGGGGVRLQEIVSTS